MYECGIDKLTMQLLKPPVTIQSLLFYTNLKSTEKVPSNLQCLSAVR